eukprot:scaffold280983_cov71-Attheya_sp.AAC.2
MSCAVQTSHLIALSLPTMLRCAYQFNALCLPIQIPSISTPGLTVPPTRAYPVPCQSEPAMPCTSMPYKPPAMSCCHAMATRLQCHAVQKSLFAACENA